MRILTLILLGGIVCGLGWFLSRDYVARNAAATPATRQEVMAHVDRSELLRDNARREGKSLAPILRRTLGVMSDDAIRVLGEREAAKIYPEMPAIAAEFVNGFVEGYAAR